MDAIDPVGAIAPSGCQPSPGKTGKTHTAPAKTIACTIG
jgi:hypothetical protein